MSLTRRARCCLAALALAVAGGAPAAEAQTPELHAPLRSEDVVRLARGHRSEIAAARARARAAEQRPVIVSRLSDPMVMVSVDHLPFSLVGADGSVLVQQDFPLSDVLGRRADVARADARRAAIDVRRAALDVELEALAAFYMLAERRGTAAVLDEESALAHQIVDTSANRYGAGQASQADVLRAQSELARIDADRAALTEEIHASEAMLDAALGLPPATVVPAIDIGDMRRTPPLADAAVRSAVASRPELAGAREEISSAQAEVHVMEAMNLPMAFVRAGPAYTMADGPGVMAMIGVSVPLWRDWGAPVNEARAMVTMAEADRAAMTRMVEGEAASARADVVTQRVRLAALRESVLPLAQQSVAASLASYASGEIPLVAVVDALRALVGARMDEVMASARLGLAWARFDRAVGRFEGDAR